MSVLREKGHKTPKSETRGELRYHHDFPSAFLGNTRTIVVHLPPGYTAEKKRRYPVLYLHDGQNLFDPATAFGGVAWDAHAIADRLAAAGRIHPVILVGVYNTPDRLHEYTVHPDPAKGLGGRGALYARFVLDELKPFLDRTYRTLSDRKHTGVAGSSLGGLISLEMARLHHDRFALCGALSPALWWAKGQVLKDLESDFGWMRGMRFWVDMGTRESNRRQAVHPGIVRLRKLLKRFDQAGLIPGRDYNYWEVAGGEHNEAAWAARFDKVLLYFFGRAEDDAGDARLPTLW